MEKPSAFISHIQNANRAALEGLITKPEVEKKLLLRLRKKAATYAQDFTPDGDAVKDSVTNGSAKIDVDGVVELYENYIIPLTKEVEVGCTNIGLLVATDFFLVQVEYLLQRLDGLTQVQINSLAER
jgi:chorismate mutase